MSPTLSSDGSCLSHLAPLCTGTSVHSLGTSAWSQHSIIKKSSLPHWQVLAGKREGLLTCNIFYNNESCFHSLSFPTKLDVATIPWSSKFLANKTHCLRISQGARYSHFLTGASWQDTHRPWGEACSTVGLCLHVFDSGKEKQKQILKKRRHFKSLQTRPVTANAKKHFY